MWPFEVLTLFEEKRADHITISRLSMIVELMTAATFNFSWRFLLLPRSIVFQMFDPFLEKNQVMLKELSYKA